MIIKKRINDFTYDESKIYIHKLNIKSKKHWQSFIKNNIIHERIPRSPSTVYKNKGWISWPDFLGNDNIKGERIYISYERFPILFDEIAPYQNIDLTKYFISQKDEFGKYIEFEWICSLCTHNWKASLFNRARRHKNCPRCSEENRKLKLRKNVIINKGSLGEKEPSSYEFWDFSLNKGTPDDFPYKCIDNKFFKCPKCHNAWEESIIKFSCRKNKCTNYTCRSKMYSQELRFLIEFSELGFDVAHQYNHKGYECDIFVKDLNLGIEIDGFYWHDNSKKIEIDESKNNLFNKDFNFLRFRDSRLYPSSFENEIYYNQQTDLLEPFMEMISYIINSFSVSPKNLSILKNYLSNYRFIGQKKYDYIISNKIVYNSLNKIFPDIAKYFSKKNLPIAPDNVHAYENKIYLWDCDYGHDYEMMVNEKTSGKRGCPICAKNGSKVDDKNNAYAKYPEIFQRFFNFQKNTLDPTKVRPNVRTKIHVNCEKNNCDIAMELRNLTREDSKSFKCTECKHRNFKISKKSS